MNDIIEELRKEWSEDGGFFYEARKMRYHQPAADRAVRKLSSVNPSKMDEVQKAKLIEHLWELPYLALFYRDRCVEMGADIDAYNKSVREIERIVSLKMRELLGLPPSL